MSTRKIRTRIAPSPTGEPHIGTAYTALFNYAFSKKHAGEFIIRIEDTDQSRLVEGAEEKVYQALSWLGLETSESPKVGGKFGPYKQSERLKIYKEKIEELLEKDAAYVCDCTPERLLQVREEQQKRGEVTHYDGKCRENPPQAKDNYVVRLKVPKEGETKFEDVIRGEISFKNQDIDDQVLMKSDGFPTYHLASVVDDHLMEISDVIRGEDWLSSTPKHVLLYKAFGWEMPTFAHLPLLRNNDKSKLSKRKNPVSILWYKDEGYLPEALVNFLSLMGWSMPDEKEIFTLEEFIEKFNLHRVDPSGPIFDLEKLAWLNGEYIRKMSDSELETRIYADKFSKYSKEQIGSVLTLVKERMKKLSEFDSLVFFFFEDIKVLASEILPSGKNPSEAVEVFSKILDCLKEIDWVETRIEEQISKVQEESGWTRGELFMSLRIALTGSRATPPLFVTIEKLGKEKTLKRLQESTLELSA